MVKKIIACTVLFLVAYCVFVSWFAPAWWVGVQDGNQANIVKAEKFIYEDKVPKYVILGSSLSGLIVQDSLPNTTNLAFGGLSVYDGFYILTHMQAVPKVVLVEMNMVFRAQKQSFTSPLFSPFTYYPRKKIAALRADKVPLAVLGKVMLGGIYNIKDNIRGRTPVAKPAMAVSPTRELSNKMVNDMYLMFFKLPEKQQADEYFAALKQYVDAMEKQGTKIVFFEMPIDNKLEETPLQVYIRKMFNQNFPPAKYTYVARPKWDYCDTSDGMHLAAAQAISYTQYLRGYMVKW